MNKLTTILSTGILAAAMAVPASALEIGAGGEIDLFEEGRVIGIGLNAGIGDEVEGSESANEADTAAAGNVLATGQLTPDADSAFLGQTVTFADGGTAGIVEEVYLDAQGAKRLYVNIDPTLGLTAERFVIGLGPQVEAEEELQLSMSEVQLRQRLAEQQAALQ